MEHKTHQEERLLIDMDGTLAEFLPVQQLEQLYEKGYFKNLKPLPNVVEAVKKIIYKNPDREIYIMSSVLSDSRYALQEKNEWLDQYLPQIHNENRIFPPCGANKLDYVPGGIRTTDYLLDDYTNNLVLWEPPAKGIKLLNGINHTKGIWNGNMLRYDKEPERLADDILSVMRGNMIQDRLPVEQRIRNLNYSYDPGSERMVTESQKEHMVFLDKVAAVRAFALGVHLCRVSDYPEYLGIQAGKYRIEEIATQEQIREVYETVGQGMVHRVCVSPFYESVNELQAILNEENSLKKIVQMPERKQMMRL